MFKFLVVLVAITCVLMGTVDAKSSENGVNLREMQTSDEALKIAIEDESIDLKAKYKKKFKMKGFKKVKGLGGLCLILCCCPCIFLLYCFRGKLGIKIDAHHDGYSRSS